MKKALVLLLLCMIPLAFSASSYNSKYIGEVIDVSSWNITTMNIPDNNSVRLEAYSNSTDAKYYIFTYGTPRDLQGLTINITDIFYDPYEAERLVWMDVTVNWEHACINATDCDDGRNGTIDYCSGVRRECQYQNITACVAGDGFCPPNCRWLNDGDCDRPCNSDDVCDDKNESSTDTCSGEVCIHKLITACENGDDFCPDGCFWNFSTSTYTDNDCSKNSNCSSHDSCDDADNSTIDTCWGDTLSTEPRYCQYDTNQTYLDSIVNETVEEVIAEPVENNETEENDTVVETDPPEVDGDAEIVEQNWSDRLQITWWKLILLLIVAGIPIYLFIALRSVKVKTAPKEKF
jgi:hypothetical protein